MVANSQEIKKNYIFSPENSAISMSLPNLK